ncbi:unnamed protein product [Ectocarpus sp. CCAP 1310/34]|nr:unnamed protein product [Ectocarpus sp. CCAP 1310/34]
MVRTIISRAERESAADVEDARQFLGKLQKEDLWVRFQLDEDRRVTHIAWALDEQKRNALRYSRIIIQDNTFNTNERVYKYHLALIVVVDKENYTQIAMQALLANERTEDYKFLFRVFRELCQGMQPEVMFTDADQAAMTAIDEECPASHQKLCLFHMDENLMKHGEGLEQGVLAGKLCLFHMDENLTKHGKGLEQGVLAGVKGIFHAAARCMVETDVPEAKANLLKQLKPDSHMYKYMADFVFEPRRVQRWASFVHPGLHTLNITSTQRVQSTNGALKTTMHRSGSMVDVHDTIVGKLRAFPEICRPLMDPGVFSHSKPTARASNWASCVAFGKELASLMTDVDAIAPCQRVLNNLTNYAKQLIEVEATSQHEATTNRIFTGVVARPVTATDPPEGGPVGAGPGGGRGRGNGRGRGRGGAGEGGGRGSRARRGRGGEGLGVSAASTPSLAVGGPALPQADGPGSTGGGGEGGGSGLGVSAAGTTSLAENFPSHRAGVAGAAMHSFPTPTNATRPVGGSGAPLRSLSNSPHDGVGQTSPGVTSSASLAFDATNSCAPESFQQSRLNGERLRAHENHGQPLPSTPHNVAFLDEVRSPPKRKQTGPTKRRKRKSSAQRNNRGGGQHVIQGGAKAAWGI